MKAIKISPLSLTIPMTAFTPAFLLITSPLIVGEFPDLYGVIGILLIVFGSYMLNIKEVKKGLLSPFKSLLKERGAILMLIVAFIWSITSNIDKVGVVNSNTIFWIVANHIIWIIAFFLILIKRGHKSFSNVRTNIKSLVPIGFFSALTSIFQMTALTLTIVPFVISIKRTSSIFSSLYGYFFFKEKEISQRLIGIIIMLVGVFLISLF